MQDQFNQEQENTKAKVLKRREAKSNTKIAELIEKIKKS